jgi:transposase
MPGGWTGRPPRLTPEALAELREIARQRKALPTNAELARKYGVSSRTILAATAGRLPKRYA